MCTRYRGYQSGFRERALPTETKAKRRTSRSKSEILLNKVTAENLLGDAVVGEVRECVLQILRVGVRGHAQHPFAPLMHPELHVYYLQGFGVWGSELRTTTNRDSNFRIWGLGCGRVWGRRVGFVFSGVGVLINKSQGLFQGSGLIVFGLKLRESGEV